MIDITPLRDSRLSWKARGLMAFLLTKPDNWEVREDNLVNESEKDGLSAVRTGLKELKAAGYFLKHPKRDAAGRITGWETLIFETPTDREEWEENHSRMQKTQNVENPECGKSTIWKTQNVENPPNGKSEGIYINDLPLSEEGSINDPNYYAATDFVEEGNGQPSGKVTPIASAPVERSAPERCNDAFQVEPLPPWRKSRGVNGIDRQSGFVAYLVEQYLPTTSHYEGKKITIANAVGWIRS